MSIVWVRSPVSGDYKSADGRFHIYHNPLLTIKWGRWVVSDRAVKDVNVANGEYDRSARKETLKSCKAQAERWAAGKNF